MSAPVRGNDEARGGRRRGREVVFRAFFEAELSGDDPLEVLDLAVGRFRFTPDARLFALRLGSVYGDRRGDIDALLERLLEKWSLSRVSSVVRAILRLAVAELLGLAESPPRVVIHEAMRLADRYGEADAGTFVNGVLDAAAREVRPGGLD